VLVLRALCKSFHNVSLLQSLEVTICNTRLDDEIFYFLHPHNVFVCFVWISEQTAIISLYNIN